MTSIRNKMTRKNSGRGRGRGTRVKKNNTAKRPHVIRKSRVNTPVGGKRTQKKKKMLRSIKRRRTTKKKRLTTKHRGGDDENDEMQTDVEITPIPLLIDDDDDMTLDEDEINQMEMDIADNSFASYSPSTSSGRNSISVDYDGETTNEDMSDDEEDDDDDVLNTAFSR